ncbi:MAG TPA: DUF222 domain-containing protein, partial [Pseudonocardiaceae bacterium]|nr:DUF222 domain-containing protein [Pseudonocardiaceae bacterium]
MEKSAEELLDTEWWRADPAEFITDLQEIETLVRRLSAQSLRAITVAESRGIAPSAGYLSLGLLLRDALRITAADAQRRMVHAEALDRHPVLAQAASDGTLGTDHIAVITSTLADLPDSLPPEEADRAEHRIVATAKLLDSRTLRAEGRRLVYDYDQDGREPVDEPLRHSDNELNYHVGRSGKVSFRGMLEPEVGAAFTALLSPLAKPRPSEDQPDLRSAEERRGDAFAEIVVLAANAAKAPVEGGERPHITVTMPL